MKKWLMAFIIALTATTGFAENKVQTNDGETINIYFARHGKTLFNTYDRVQGWGDSPLTADGIQVAQYLGEGLKGIKFDSFYSSDAGRQRETMQVILNQMGIKDYKLIELPGLREAFFGGFEGDFNKNMAEAGAKQLGLSSAKELFDKMKAGELPVEQNQNALAAADPKGTTENYAQIKERTQQALQIIADNAVKNGEKNVLAISSGTSMQIMISDLTDDVAKNKPLSNAAVVKITYKNGKFTVAEIGNMEYVNAGKKALGK
jgi:broad specificity phosphatase PhoE